MAFAIPLGLAIPAALTALAGLFYAYSQQPAVKQANADLARRMGDNLTAASESVEEGINKGLDKAKEAIKGIAKEFSQSQSCSTNACGGDDDPGDDKDKKEKTPEEKAQEELGELKGKSKSEIRQKLKELGYKPVESFNKKGEVWTKDLGNGKTQGVRIDPPVKRLVPRGWGDEVDHVQKELVPTDRISKGNYQPEDVLKRLNDKGMESLDKRELHIPIKPW